MGYQKPTRALRPRSVNLSYMCDEDIPAARRGCLMSSPAGYHTHGMRTMGSSPRVRGKRDLVPCEQAPQRLIPARAGKTCSLCSWTPPARAHPRACGENAFFAVVGAVRVGSSPRVRGKRVGRRVQRARERLIPARAGKTRSRPRPRRSAGAHPRACGENVGEQPVALPVVGSSPRVRGKLRAIQLRCPRAGLIPARAGKTGRGDRGGQGAGAHPRACGENRPFVPTQEQLDGSSPRVRGKLASGPWRSKRRGLIPARAGKTDAQQPSVIYPWAHPRACGENVPTLVTSQAEAGSSPRVRGKLSSHRSPVRDPGLIPARAGKTVMPIRSSPVGRAHPRACGENLVPRSRGGSDAGSSPRVRGKLKSRWSCCGPSRLIPARAGKTRSSSS